MVISGNNLTTTNNTIISNEALQTYGFKNRIINGAMMIDQRNNGAGITAGSGYVYFTDRFKIYSATASKFSGQQVSVTTNGFKKALKLTTLVATTPDAGHEYELYHNIEGYNVADLSWGSANAKTVTLSFIVNSSIAGTFAGCINNNGAGGTIYSYVFTYTINSANTDTQITLTIPGATVGTWSSDYQTGLQIIWDIGSGSNYNGTAGVWSSTFKTRTSGSVSLNGTVGATFQITGVQLEQGTVATPFEQRPYGLELSLCQRYYWQLNGAGANDMIMLLGAYTTGGAWGGTIKFPVTMRVAPSITTSSASTFTLYSGSTGYTCTTLGTFVSTTEKTYNNGSISSSAPFALGQAVNFAFNTVSGFISASAEL